MKQNEPVVKVVGCAHCPAFMAGAGPAVCARAISVIPSRMVAQVTDGVWNAVVTTLDKGTFLIRRLKGLPAHDCSLQTCEIRHIEADPPPGRKRAGDSAHRRKKPESCRDLFVRVRTRRMD